MKIRLAAFTACLLLAGPALADQAAADKCAASLSPAARTIYAATAPAYTAGADLKALVTDKTRALVKAGTVSMGEARDAARAAGACLKLMN
ncbi:hypothetical protein [Pseudoxanthobacter sp.]|uniref:hypothetical protein n=1 Tax=Pseudoxanthobacter sp. TaxID=1925742 RepID=UPI002FE2EC4C